MSIDNDDDGDDDDDDDVDELRRVRSVVVIKELEMLFLPAQRERCGKREEDRRIRRGEHQSHHRDTSDAVIKNTLQLTETEIVK